MAIDCWVIYREPHWPAASRAGILNNSLPGNGIFHPGGSVEKVNIAMSTSDLTRRERQKAARRAAILQAAREVFLPTASFPATIEAVARRANISKGSVYLYFESKEALLAELLYEGLQLLDAQLTAAFSEHTDLKPDVRVARLAGAYLEFAQSQPGYFQLSIAFASGQLQPSTPNPVRARIGQLDDRGADLIASAIRDGIASKAFRRVNAQQIATALWAALKGALLATIYDRTNDAGENPSVDTLFQTILEMFFRALRRHGD